MSILFARGGFLNEPLEENQDFSRLLWPRLSCSLKPRSYHEKPLQVQHSTVRFNSKFKSLVSFKENYQE